MKSLGISILASFILLGTTAMQATGQQPNQDVADALLRQAQAAEDQASNSEGADGKWEAARLHLESVRYRAADDPQAVASLRAAAMYLAYDRPARGAELFVEAAQRAIEMNDPTTAAESYMDAASALLGGKYRTVSERDFTRAKNWMNQAATVLTADSVTEADRIRIMNRFQLDAGLLAG